ncbi:MAG: transporter [Acidobacteria bacterium]|nr:MAG: transporter [Acidobacteriota bacterium]
MTLRWWVVIFLGVLVPRSVTHAQELEPRLYRNVPVGLNALVVGYGFSNGNVLFDTSLPFQDVDADLSVVSVGYLRTLDFFGRLAKLEVIVPFAAGKWEGLVNSEARTRDVAGLADPRFRFGVNFLGSPALRGEGFGSYDQRTIVGASISVAVPLGQYDSEKLINLGANRWSFLPEIGVSHHRGRWYFELASGTWLFTANDDFFGGSRMTQNPILFVKGHVVRSFRPALWLAFNFGFAYGGEFNIDGSQRDNFQKNSRLGLTLSLPLSPGNSIRVNYASGVATRIGADFDSIGIVYQRTWVSK